MVDATTLRAALIQSLIKNELSRNLAALCLQVAIGRLQCNRSGLVKLSDHDRDEILSLFSVRLVKYWRNINPDKNIFAYITTMLDFAKRDWLREKAKHHEKLQYTEHTDQDASGIQVQQFILESKTARHSNKYKNIRRITISEITTIERMAKKMEDDVGDIISALTSEIRALKKIIGDATASKGLNKELRAKMLSMAN